MLRVPRGQLSGDSLVNLLGVVKALKDFLYLLHPHNMDKIQDLAYTWEHDKAAWLVLKLETIHLLESKDYNLFMIRTFFSSLDSELRYSNNYFLWLSFRHNIKVELQFP